VPFKLSQPLIDDTPGVIQPEPALPFAHSLPAAIRAVRKRHGVLAAWVSQSALTDRVPGEPGGAEAVEALVVVLSEPGHEASEAFEAPGSVVVVTALDEVFLRDAMEWDDELALVVATGYRLCGAEREAIELETLAREIVSVKVSVKVAEKTI